MSELSELYADMRQAKKEKRSHNTQSSTRILSDHGVKFESKNNGSHLVVDTGKGFIDFWPPTGRFIPRDGSKKGRGVFNLIKKCWPEGK